MTGIQFVYSFYVVITYIYLPYDPSSFCHNFHFQELNGYVPSLTNLNETKESHQHLSLLNSLSQVRSETSIVVNHRFDDTQFRSLSSIFTHPVKTPEPWVYFEMVKFDPHIFLCHGNESSVIQVAYIRSLTGHPSLIQDIQKHTSYLSFILHEQSFWRIKFTPKNTNFSR